MNKDYYAYNLSGSLTGEGRTTVLPDGRVQATASFGSPFAGSICDDGPSYEATFATLEEAQKWLESRGFGAYQPRG